MTSYSACILDVCAHSGDAKEAVVKFMRSLINKEDETAAYLELKQALELAQYPNRELVRQAVNSATQDYLEIRPFVPLLSSIRVAILREKNAALAAELAQKRAELAKMREAAKVMDRLISTLNTPDNE